MLSVGLIKNAYNNFTLNRAQNAPAAQAPRLKTLERDTVSFGSKGLLLNKSLYEGLGNEAACESVYSNAKVVAKDFMRQMEETFSPLIYTSYDNPDAPVENLKTRVKSTRSIREKVTEEIQYALEKDMDRMFSPKDPEAIKKVVGDVVGSRVILKSPDTKKTSKIIDALIKEVEAGRIKITNIENYEPKNLNSELKYFSRKDLMRLQKAANKARWENDSFVELSYKENKSGYMALHIDVDLSSEKYDPKNNNYKGEIQFMGPEVEKLKDVEDFCYKLKQDKSPKGGHPAYKLLVDYFKHYMSSEIKGDYEKYTKKAFLFQRTKETLNQRYNSLPTIEQCDLKGVVPRELDFNNIAKILHYCDGLYNLTRDLYNDEI